MRKSNFFIYVVALSAAHLGNAAAKLETTHDMTDPTMPNTQYIVGPCSFSIADMYGGEFRVNYRDNSPPKQGVYYLPITGPGAFVTGGFGLFCKEASEDRITGSLNGKYVDGRWWSSGPANGPEYVPYEKEAKATTIPLKGKNWTGLAYTEDFTTGDERGRPRMFHFCLIHNTHALCGSTVVRWLADSKKRNDLRRIKAILESVEFIDTPSLPDTSSATGATASGM